MLTFDCYWRFENGREMQEVKFYVSDETAIRGSVARMKKHGRPGDVIRLCRVDTDNEVACIRYNDAVAGRVLGTTLRLTR